MVELKHSSYFEGILQLRDHTPELQEWIEKTVREDDKAVIVKLKVVRGGTDFYLSSQRYLQALGKKLKKHFSGEIKTSARLHTKSRTGKDLYRVTVLFRPAPYVKGEHITFDGEIYEIITLDRHAVIKNMKTGQKRIVPFEYLARHDVTKVVVI